MTVNQTLQCAALKAWRPSWPMISAAAKRQAPFHHLSALATALLMATPLDLVYEMPLPSVLDDTIAVGAKTLWLQSGLWHEQVARVGEAAGLHVVMDRCLKVEHARLFG